MWDFLGRGLLGLGEEECRRRSLDEPGVAAARAAEDGKALSRVGERLDVVGEEVELVETPSAIRASDGQHVGSALPAAQPSCRLPVPADDASPESDLTEDPTAVGDHRDSASCAVAVG
jgi:hypothetical protein